MNFLVMYFTYLCVFPILVRSSSPIYGTPCYATQGESLIYCDTTAQNATFSSLVFGSVTTSYNLSVSSTYTNYTNCLVDGCFNYNVRCSCSNAINSNSCVLGNFYSLRKGPSQTGTCLFGAFSPLIECLDTNWVPSTVSPLPICPYFQISLNPTVSVSGNYIGFSYAYSSVINYSISNLTNVYKKGSSFVRLTSPTNKIWSISNTFSSNVTGYWTSSCSGNPTSLNSPILGSFTNQFCSVNNYTEVNLNSSVTLRHYFVLNSTRWFKILSILPGLNLTVLYCTSVCERYDPLTDTFAFLPSGTYVYEPYSSYSNYDCVISNCVSIDCCNPSYIRPSPPCALGETVCLSNISYYDTSNGTFVSYQTGSQFYCDDASGVCYVMSGYDEYTFNTLVIILLVLLAVFVLSIIIFYLCSLRNSSTINM